MSFKNMNLKDLTKKKKSTEVPEIPSIQELEEELKRVKHNHRFHEVLRSTVYALITVAAGAVLVATLFLPVLQIHGGSMSPTLSEGEIVCCIKGDDFEIGDILAFYYNNKVLVKRYIAGPGSWVDIDENGTVTVDGEVIDEPYLTDKTLGQCDIELPYQVPDDRYFVMGDHRSTSVDSRTTTVGCVPEEQIVGRIVFRVWPLENFGGLS